MKKYLLALLTIIPFSCMFAQTPLLENGDMEDWGKKNNSLQKWNIPPHARDFFKQSTNAHSGKYSLQVIFEPEKKYDNRRINTSAIELAPGKYEVSLFIKGTGEFRYITLTKNKQTPGSKDNEFNVVGVPSIGKIANTAWEEYKLSFNIEEKDIYNLHIGVNYGAPDDPILIDDIKIVKQ